MAGQLVLLQKEEELCEHCRSWDFANLFIGDRDKAHQLGRLKEEDCPRVWDRRPLDDIRQNTQCKLCHLVVSLVTTGTAWDVAQKSTTKLFVQYSKDWFANYSPPSSDPDSDTGTVVPISILALELLDDADPAKSSRSLTLEPFQYLQAFHFGNESAKPFLNNMLIGRHFGAEVDFDLVRAWISSCDSHGKSCLSSISDGTRGSNIMLIDVRRRCVVHAPTSSKYAALSYVWGTASSSQLQLTHATIERMTQDDALADDNELIPKTILDALAVCARLSIPNLWVDALCIQQDSPDFNANLGIMNEIYASAFFTIVAASGANSWAGLPGVMPRSREVHQPTVQIGAVKIGRGIEGSFDSVEKSPWADRGWTFQERLFSKRMLIFTHSQSFFVCGKTSRFESTHSELPPAVKTIEHDFCALFDWIEIREKLAASLAGEGIDDPLASFFEILRQYRGLEFTYSGDVLRAFGGVIGAFQRQLSTDFYYGLPESHFTQGLLLDHLQCARRPDFPSWSWAGWKHDRYFWDFDSKQPFTHEFRALDVEATVVFYRLHPTKNSAGEKQKSWVLKSISDKKTPPAANFRKGVQRILHEQYLPSHLKRSDLNALLFFEAPTAFIKVAVDSSIPRGGGSSFDDYYRMTYAYLQISDDTRYRWPELDTPPYLSTNLFTDVTTESPFLLMEFVMLAQEKDPFPVETALVNLMIIETDMYQVSRKLCITCLPRTLWQQANPTVRKIFLL